MVFIFKNTVIIHVTKLVLFLFHDKNSFIFIKKLILKIKSFTSYKNEIKECIFYFIQSF